MIGVHLPDRMVINRVTRCNCCCVLLEQLTLGCLRAIFEKRKNETVAGSVGSSEPQYAQLELTQRASNQSDNMYTAVPVMTAVSERYGGM
jgi:hypothetical protein